MNEPTARIATICECIDHCFSFEIWCRDFAKHVDPEDLMMGLDRGHELVGDATRLLSFIAVRKIDEFLHVMGARKDDLISADLGIDTATIIKAMGGGFLTRDERKNINKGVVHLTQRLTLDADSEVDLQAILSRALPLLTKLVAGLRVRDETGEAAHWLDRTDALIARVAEGE